MRASGGNNDAPTVPGETPEPVMGVIVLPDAVSSRRRPAGPHSPRPEGSGRPGELGRFRELLQLLPDAYLYTDVEGHLLELNPAAEALFGVAMADERQLLDLVDSEDRAEVEQLLASARVTTLPEARFRSTDGRGFVAEVRVAPEVRRRRRVGLVWLVRKLRDQVDVEDLGGDVLCELPVLAYASDGNGRWKPQLVSPRLAHLLGFSPEDLAGAPGQWDEQIHPDDRQRVVEGRQRACADRVAVRVEYRVLTRHGLVRWVRDEMRPVATDHGTAIRGVVVDLSDLTRDPQARADARRRGIDEDSAAPGRAIDESANKRTFLRLFLHDVRSPLAVAVAIVETLLREEDDLAGDQRRSLLSRAVTNLAQIHHLLSEVLDIERLEQRRVVVRREATDVAGVVASVVAEMPENDHVISFEGPACTIDTDPALVARAVRKLLDNALTHTPLETCVWVSVRDDPDGVLLSVEDDGVGVADELKERIFEAFERGTAPATTSGFGLGLALVRHIAELLGGRAWVEDRPGGGAAFRLLLAR